MENYAYYYYTYYTLQRKKTVNRKKKKKNRVAHSVFYHTFIFSVFSFYNRLMAFVEA